MKSTSHYYWADYNIVLVYFFIYLDVFYAPGYRSLSTVVMTLCILVPPAMWSSVAIEDFSLTELCLSTAFSHLIRLIDWLMIDGSI